MILGESNGLSTIPVELYAKNVRKMFEYLLEFSEDVERDFQADCVEAARIFFHWYQQGALNNMLNKKLITRALYNGCINLINFDTDYLRDNSDFARKIVIKYAKSALKERKKVK